MRRKIFLITLALLFIAMMGYLIVKNIDQPEVFEVVHLEKRDIVKKTVANGSVVPRQAILIKPTVSGIVKELLVEAGDQVEEGDVLAKIQIVPDMVSLSSAESRVRQAEISVQDAQKNYERNKPLFDKGVISSADLQVFENALNSALESLRGAEDNLSVVKDGISKSSRGASNTLVRSTVTGMVLDVPIKVGNSVIERNNFNEGTSIAEVADMSDLIFEGKLDESEVGKVRLGMPIVLTIGAIDKERWDAELEYIAPKGVEEDGAIQFEIRAAVKLDSTQTLRSGYSANADIVLDERKEVASLPESVITFNSKGDSAFVQVKEGEGWNKTAIETGLSDGIHVEVTGGIDDSMDIKGALKRQEKGGKDYGG
jgi:HlyD family secretion protein